jgi:hypothetical protein
VVSESLKTDWIQTFPSGDGKHYGNFPSDTCTVDSLNFGNIPTPSTGIVMNPTPIEYLLFQNFPNPFNTETQIRFQIPKNTFVKIRIYNVLGQCIRTLSEKEYPAGVNNVKWDGKDDKGIIVGSGIYFIFLDAGTYKSVKRILLIK